MPIFSPTTGSNVSAPVQSVVVAATSNVTRTAPGASIDGIVLATGDRVLLTAQTTTSENGIYTFQGAASTLTAVTTAVGTWVFVNQGTQAQSGWEATSATTWVQFAAPIQPQFPGYQSGHYYYASSPGGNGAAIIPATIPRVHPFIVPTQLTIARVGTEFTVAGDAASVVRLGIWNDDGTGFPSTVLADFGTISTGSGNAGTVATGGTPGTYEITLGTPLVITPGVYWIGSVTQGVTTTGPTLRTINSTNIIYPVSQLTTKPTTGLSSAGFLGAAQSGALATFASPGITSNIARLFFKVN